MHTTEDSSRLADCSDATSDGVGDNDDLPLMDDLLSFLSPLSDEDITTTLLAEVYHAGLSPILPRIEPIGSRSNTSPADAHVLPTAAKKKRKRPKDELDWLRGAVGEMQVKLAALKRAKRRPRAKQGGSRRPRDRDVMAAHWERIAKRQKAAVDQSLATNLRLRAVLQEQLAVGKQLEDRLKHVQKLALIEIDGGSRSVQFHTDSISPSDVFAMLNADLDALYLGVDRVVRNSELAGVEYEDVKAIQAVSGADGGLYFQQTEVRIMPFSMVAVNRAIWAIHAPEALKDHGMEYTAQGSAEDTINATIVGSVQLSTSGSIGYKIMLTMRRYVAAGRIVAVWNSVVEIVDSMSVCLREQGWILLEPMVISGDNAAPACVSRSVVRVTPETTDAELSDRERWSKHPGELTRLVVGTYNCNIPMLRQLVENALMAHRA